MTRQPESETVRCRHCRAPAGARCRTLLAGLARRAHAIRVRDSLAAHAHADPVLDEFFPDSGECGICDAPGLDGGRLGARHRRIDAIAERIAAGEDAGDVVADYGLPGEAVPVLLAWMSRWQGAWG